MKYKIIIKHLWNKLIELLKNKNFYFIILAVLPFIVMDWTTRYFTRKIGFVNLSFFTPWLFTIVWSVFFVGFSLSFRKKIAKILYSVFFIISFILFFAHNVYFSFTKEIFDFHLIELANEGSTYFIDALKATNIGFYLIALSIFLIFIFCLIKLPTSKQNNYPMLIFFTIAFIILHSLAPLTLGKANTNLSWNTWYNKRNIYINFNDSNKSFRITGLYEYSIRNFYLTFIVKEKKEDESQIEFLSSLFNGKEEKHKNEYTGAFKGKNLIFLQLEGIDNWLVTKETMPNLYSLMSKSINFTNHYSFYNGGGSTFNSEFAVNTGYLTPISYTKNAYTFNKNTFTYSMANIFKNAGYTVNAFHMNSGEYYSRNINYKSWGYDNYYGLKDSNDYNDNSYQLDRELILNENFYNLMFKSEKKFVNYIITYSTHTPFSSERGVCKMILDKKDEEAQKLALENNQEYETTEYNYTEEECIKIQASETDYMIGLLIQALKDNNLYDNTVIVAYADHYLYTVSDKTILDKYKNTTNNLINHTPLFIWSNNIKKKTITKVTSQINILPTILNLFGLEYHEVYYSGEDALDKSYEGIAFFNDYSWYDGKIYVDSNGIADSKVDNDLIAEKSNYVNYLIKKNDLVLKYDYFKKLKKSLED